MLGTRHLHTEWMIVQFCRQVNLGYQRPIPKQKCCYTVIFYIYRKVKDCDVNLFLVLQTYSFSADGPAPKKNTTKK